MLLLFTNTPAPQVYSETPLDVIASSDTVASTKVLTEGLVDSLASSEANLNGAIRNESRQDSIASTDASTAATVRAELPLDSINSIDTLLASKILVELRSDAQSTSDDLISQWIGTISILDSSILSDASFSSLHAMESRNDSISLADSVVEGFSFSEYVSDLLIEHDYPDHRQTMAETNLTSAVTINGAHDDQFGHQDFLFSKLVVSNDQAALIDVLAEFETAALGEGIETSLEVVIPPLTGFAGLAAEQKLQLLNSLNATLMAAFKAINLRRALPNGTGTTVVLQKLTPGGSSGSLTFVDGILVAKVDPT